MISKISYLSTTYKLLFAGIVLTASDVSAPAAEDALCPTFKMPEEHCPGVDLSICDPLDLKCQAEKLMACPSRFKTPPGHEPYHLKIDYPQTEPEAEESPWLKFDPFSATSPEERAEQSRGYLSAVLAYAMEGNNEVDWRVEKNTVREWYHAPWMHYDDANGREPLRGLTRELCSKPNVLHSKQTKDADNWAVGFYNAPGGYLFGQVWKSWTEAATCPSAPVKPVNVDFPEGTVSFKLLFTTATVEQVPYLEDAPTWQAYIRPTTREPMCDADYSTKPHNMRLLQFDIAVKDTRSGNPTGWTFGTFIYKHDGQIKDEWNRLVPVGLQWGNDPQREQKDLADLDPSKWWDVPLREGWLNREVASMFQKEGREWLGLHGRLNGPVDNWKSGCTACHSAQAVGHRVGGSLLERPESLPWHACGSEDPKIGERCTVTVHFKRYFSNRDSDESYEPDFLSLDYSLQLSKGLEAYVDWLNKAIIPDSKSTQTDTSTDGSLASQLKVGTPSLQFDVPAKSQANIRR